MEGFFTSIFPGAQSFLGVLKHQSLWVSLGIVLSELGLRVVERVTVRALQLRDAKGSILHGLCCLTLLCSALVCACLGSPVVRFYPFLGGSLIKTK